MDRKDMFHYIIAGPNAEFKINSKGFFKNTSELVVENIEQSSTMIHSRTTYPNGVIFESKTTSEMIELWTSHRLIVSPTFEIVFDIPYPVVVKD